MSSKHIFKPTSMKIFIPNSQRLPRIPEVGRLAEEGHLWTGAIRVVLVAKFHTRHRREMLRIVSSESMRVQEDRGRQSHDRDCGKRR